MVHETTEKFDSNKTKISFLPNLIHNQDSFIIRLPYLIGNYRLRTLTIHDCALVSYKEIPMFVSSIQNSMNNLPILQELKKFDNKYSRDKVESPYVVL